MFKKLAFLACTVGSVFAAEKTNILFIFSDDHATQAISAYGGRFAKVAAACKCHFSAASQEQGIRMFWKNR